MRRILFPRAGCLSAALLLSSWLIPSTAYSQPTASKAQPAVDSVRRCLSVRQLARIADSLRVLPYVREDAGYWRAGALGLQSENAELRRGLRDQSNALLTRGLELGNEQQKALVATHRARRRGLLVAVLAAAEALTVGFFISHR